MLTILVIVISTICVGAFLNSFYRNVIPLVKIANILPGPTGPNVGNPFFFCSGNRIMVMLSLKFAVLFVHSFKFKQRFSPFLFIKYYFIFI